MLCTPYKSVSVISTLRAITPFTSIYNSLAKFVRLTDWAKSSWASDCIFVTSKASAKFSKRTRISLLPSGKSL